MARSRCFLWQCLRGMLEDRSAARYIRTEIQERPPNWAEVLELANRHMISPMLHVSLSRLDLYPMVPPAIREYLGAVYQLNRTRNIELLVEMRRVTPLFNRLGVRPLLLKGVASLSVDLYSDIGARVVGDLDLLVPADRIEALERILVENGYEPNFDSPEYWQTHRHAPPLRHRDKPVKIELHRRILDGPLAVHLDVEQVTHAAIELDLSTGKALLPSPIHRVLHNVFHTQLEDRYLRRRYADLRQVLEFAVLREKYDREIDWVHLVERIREKQLRQSLMAFLALSQDLFSQPLPDGIQTGMYATMVARHQRVHLKSDRCYRLWNNTLHYLGRLSRLPRRLVTPRWYREKYRLLCKQSSRTNL